MEKSIVWLTNILTVLFVGGLFTAIFYFWDLKLKDPKKLLKNSSLVLLVVFVLYFLSRGFLSTGALKPQDFLYKFIAFLITFIVTPFTVNFFIYNIWKTPNTHISIKIITAVLLIAPLYTVVKIYTDSGFLIIPFI